MNAGNPPLQAVQRRSLAARWSLQRGSDGAWFDIPGPDTVAAALRALGEWSLDAAPQRFDAEDWCFRATFDAPPDAPAHTLREFAFDGLAGRCSVTLNGAPLLASDNMHRQHRVAAPKLRARDNELLLRFESLDRWMSAPGARRPRPRWRAPMVENQQLRWARVSLLGRTPGWSPPAAAVGPWRAVEWCETRRVAVARRRVRAQVLDGAGVLAVSLDLAALGDTVIDSAELCVERAGVVQRCALERGGSTPNGFSATLSIPEVALWWPHTHGEPALYDARVQVQTRDADAPVTIDLGRIGFRTLTLDTRGGDFALQVNGVPVFCRGACWTPLDVVSLKHTPEACRSAIEQARDAGMNMLRVSGSMVYEDDTFHDACDALGLLVWQDFMFANMDYPAADPAFAALVRDEVVQQLERWQARPSLAVLCGNSEAEQQAAMWGAPREDWSQPLFDRDLAELSAALCAGVPYWPSSAHGGAFPHQNNVGTTSYYGVGAYLRPLEDARRSGLRFATECLAFSNIPAPSTLARMPNGAALRVGHAGWKARAPRDLGAGWDFEDVRDHYLQRLFGIDPIELRGSDHARYLALSRAVGAEVMHASFAEWRRAGSGCRGALVWLLRDLWAGAGWGLLDEQGAPKAAFHGLKRALAPVAVFISDEGTNGLELHVVNDPGRTLAATIEIALYREDGLRMRQVAQTHTIAPHSAAHWPLAQWFDEFIDLSRAYRFGPSEYALVVATLRDAHGARLGQAFHFPDGLPTRIDADVGLGAEARTLDGGRIAVTLRSVRFAQSVQLDVPGFVTDDAFFHLAPGDERTLHAEPHAGTAPSAFAGQVIALNSRATASVRLP